MRGARQRAYSGQMRLRPLYLVGARVLALVSVLALGACASDSGPAVIEYGTGFHPACPPRLTVAAGDTVYTLSRRCGVSVRALIAANRLRPPFLLRAGQRLVIPGAGWYVVRRGDTLLALAYRFHVPFQRLVAANHTPPPYRIFVGERLRIPIDRAARHAEAEVDARTRRVGLPSRPSRPIHAEFAPAEPARRRPPANVAELTHPAFIWPIRGRVIIGFGPHIHGHNNDGINIAAAEGTPIRAADGGTIVYVGNQLKGFGNLILIKHEDGWMTAYAHTDRVLVRRGEVVRTGQVIATVGATGAVRRPQLHFEIRHGVEAVDPIQYLPRQPVR